MNGKIVVVQTAIQITSANAGTLAEKRKTSATAVRSLLVFCRRPVPDIHLDSPLRVSNTTAVKAKSKIITDPKKMFEICLSQPRVSRERAIHSILVQNGKSGSQALAKKS